ncbi:tRNA lysidine(34) synthetase TilS [Thermostilla marina]
MLAAVSGGADSVAMLRALAALRRPGAGRLIAVHVHHGLRGEEADADAEFVVDLAEQLQLPCRLVHPSRPIREMTAAVGLEAAARRARYQLLAELAGELGARYVATAHTADDQVETVLHRILRGTGIRGLGGIPRTRPLPPAVLIRPLLEVTRAELRSYLSAIGQPFREDCTNHDLRYTRNRIRHRLLPLLRRRFNPSVDRALGRLARLAQDQAEIRRFAVEQVDRLALRTKRSGCIVVDPARLRTVPGPVVREWLYAIWTEQGWPLRDMTARHWHRLEQAVRSVDPPSMQTRGLFTLPGAVDVRSHGKLIIIRRRSAAEPSV